MKTRGLLVRVPGYPTQIDSFLPDRKLATVAGYLKEAGIEAEIIDFGTPAFLTSLIPDSLRESVITLVKRLDAAGEVNNPFSALHMMWTVHSTDRAFRSAMAKKCREIAELLAQRSSDFIVFSVQGADDVEPIFQIAGELRELCPQQKVALIGRYADLYGEMLAGASEAIDCIFRGDGESVVPSWADRLSSRYDWSELPNLIFRENGKIRRTVAEPADLTRMPVPLYDPEVYPCLEDEGNKLRIFEIEESRGCPRLCYSCSRMTTERWMRPRPVRSVCDEIRRLQAVYSTIAFRFSDTTASGAAHSGSVALALLRQGLVTVSARRIHVCSASSDVFQSLHASGCHVVTFNVDTGSQRLLEDCFGKNTCVTHMETLLREAKRAGLRTIVRLTYPSPGDDYHTREETLRFLTRTKPDFACVVLPEMHPRSVWFGHATRFGFWIPAKYLEQPWAQSRTRFPLPVGRWQNLPYRVGSFASSQVVQEQESLLAAVEGMGIPTGITEVYALAGHMLGQTPSAVRAELTTRMFSGDVESLQDWLRKVNEVLMVPAAGRSAKPLRPAVGEP